MPKPSMRSPRPLKKSRKTLMRPVEYALPRRRSSPRDLIPSRKRRKPRKPPLRSRKPRLLPRKLPNQLSRPPRNPNHLSRRNSPRLRSRPRNLLKMLKRKKPRLRRKRPRLSRRKPMSTKQRKQSRQPRQTASSKSPKTNHHHQAPLPTQTDF